MKRILLSVVTAVSVVSAQATIVQYTVNLNGANESPVNASPGTGTGTVNYDDVNHLLQVQVSFTGLIQTNAVGGVTQAHIHGPTTTPGIGTAGVVISPGTLPGFPLGVFSGNYSNTLDMTLAATYPAAFISNNGGTPAGAEAAWAAAMAQGRTYFNIHSSSIGGGEIRGFLAPVPEPSSLALAALGVAGVAARVWSKRRAKKS